MHRSHFLLSLLFIAAPVAARGQVAVELVNMPTRVRSFEPVYVLYSLENTGKTPIYLPAESIPGSGPAVYLARAGEEPRWFGVAGDRIFPHAEETLWLAPGERWLFYEDISYWLGLLEGEVSVQVVLSSDGLCGGRQVGGRHSFPLEPLRVDSLKVGVKTFDVYRCWQGEVRSNEWRLTVERPTSTVDEEAFEYLRRKRALVRDEESDRWFLVRGAGVEERYPTSSYTYAVLARGHCSMAQKNRALELQPGNPLNPWVEAAVERDALDLAAHQEHRIEDRSIPEEKGDALPKSVREFLDQHAWALEHRRQKEGTN